jgi:hypothetical protein
MESIFFNGGFIGKTFDFTDTDKYILNEGATAPNIELVANTGRVTLTGASITLPSGLQPGDLVIVASASDDATPSYATGYTAGQQGRSSVGYQWCYKFMGNPVDTTATGLTNDVRTAHLAIAFRGVNPTTPLDVSSPSVATGGSGTPNPPPITTVTDNSVVVALGFLDDDNVAATAGAPANFTFAAASQGSSGGATVMAAFRLKTPAGSENPGAFSGGDDDWVATNLALRIAPAPEPVFGNQKNSGIWKLESTFIDTTISGGEITTPGDGYVYHTFASSDTLSVKGLPGTSKEIEYLIVAGGGGGGSRVLSGGGGGGAGGMLTGNMTLSVGSYTVTIGGGGTGGPSTAATAGTKGSNTVFNTVTSEGGGGGGIAGNDANNKGGDGGSGGGEGGNTGSGGGGVAVSGQGNNGGAAPGITNTTGGGGGGGKGFVGGEGNTNNVAGNGGDGAVWPSGSSTYYAGGGGGGGRTGSRSSGGLGGGGDGGQRDGGTLELRSGIPGTPNTGGGGGGGAGTSTTVGAGANGGSGIVIIRYMV